MMGKMHFALTIFIEVFICAQEFLVMMSILYETLENKINHKYYIEVFGELLFSVYYDFTHLIVTFFP